MAGGAVVYEPQVHDEMIRQYAFYCGRGWGDAIGPSASGLLGAIEKAGIELPIVGAARDRLCWMVIESFDAGRISAVDDVFIR